VAFVLETPVVAGSVSKPLRGCAVAIAVLDLICIAAAHVVIVRAVVIVRTVVVVRTIIVVRTIVVIIAGTIIVV